MRLTTSSGALITLLFLGGCRTTTPAVNVVVKPVSPKLGDTLRIEIAGLAASKIECRLDGKEYPVFPIGKQVSRALIGLHAEWKPGAAVVEITEKKWFRRDEKHLVPLEIKKKSLQKRICEWPKPKPI